MLEAPEDGNGFVAAVEIQEKPSPPTDNPDAADDQTLFASLVLLEDLDVPEPVFPKKSRFRHKVGSFFEEHFHAILRKFKPKTHFGTDTS